MSLPFFILFAVVIQHRHQGPTITFRESAMVAATGAAGYYVASYLDFAGLQHISAGLERLILFLYPTLVVLLSALIYRRAVHHRQRVALLLSYAGIAIVFGDQLSLPSSDLITGSSLVFGSAITFALFLLASGALVRRLGSARFTAYGMSAACIITIGHFGVSHGLDDLVLPVPVYGIAILMAVFSTVLPAFLMNAGVGRIGSSQASIISTAGPVVTLILAYFLLGEQISVTQSLGTALILFGTLITARR